LDRLRQNLFGGIRALQALCRASFAEPELTALQVSPIE
jgi:hypothetical protein